MAFNDLTSDVVGTALGALDSRQKVLANNLANVNTPGYKRQMLEFDDQLTGAIERAERGSRGALDDVSLVPTVDGATTMRADGNNVDVDVEMARLSENQVRYNTLVEIMSKRMQMLRYVATDGRG